MNKIVRTINVTGEAKLKVSPDCIKIPMTFQDTLKTYDECLETCSNILNTLKSELKSINFDERNIKTVDFKISPKYEYSKGVIGGEKKILKGYTYYDELYITFKFEPKKVAKVLEIISNLKVKPVFTIQYTIFDYTKVKNELLKKAVETSKKNAEIIALGLGVTLGKAINVDYHWSENSAPTKKFLPKMKNWFFSNDNEDDEEDIAISKSSNSYNNDNDLNSIMSLLDATPEDIELKDTINVVWEILDLN